MLPAASRRSASEPLRGVRIRAAVAALALLTAGCAPSPAEDAAATLAPTDPAPRHEIGWVAWESNRTGAYRIWIRPLAGGAPRQLSPDEPGRDHCCAHLSPDGERVVYLSVPGGSRSYQPPTTDGALHLVGTDGRGDRVIARPARNYGEHRAAVWWTESELAYLPDDGSTRLLDLASGGERTLVPGAGPEQQGWLVDPTGRWATTGTPSFSDRDPATGKVRRATVLGGCQPYFTADGELGYWAAGAGGPIDVLDPATRASRSILNKNDSRLPAGWRYLYFPMVSRDRTLLAYAASGGEHDHFRADYEVFVVEIDPATLEPVAAPERVSRDRGVDRFPDVWRLAPPREPAARRGGRPLPAAEPGAPILVWRSAEDLNRPTPDAPSEELETRGAVYTDRLGRLAFAGGYAAAPEDRGAELDAALKATNQITLGLLVDPRSIARDAGGPLVALAYSNRDRGFLLRQSGPRLELVIRRSRADGRLGGPPWTIGELPDAGPHHVAFRFSPGRVAAFVDGVETFRAPAPDDFFHWRNRSLRLGSELGSDERFRGLLSQLVIWDRELDDAAIAREAERALGTVRESPAVEALEVEARLVARSTPPTLAEISPYRRALVVEEYQRSDGTRLRVARWALLDGERTPAMATPIGATVRLRLEPYDAQPQLESVVLADTLPSAPVLPLHFEASLADG